eukprot:scaffold12492_cov36-Cyclotella_meneghiniana.AAC.4
MLGLRGSCDDLVTGENLIRIEGELEALAESQIEDQPSTNNLDNVSWGQYITIENFLPKHLLEREVKTIWKMEYPQSGLQQYNKKLIATKSTDISNNRGGI